MTVAAPIAVTGASALTSLGADATLWRHYHTARGGQPALGPVPLPTSGLPAALAERVARAERVSALTLVAGAGALAAAGLGDVDGVRERTGIVLGTAFGCFLTNAAYQRRLAAGGQTAASPRLFAATVSNAAAGELAIALRLAGPGITLTAGCAAGLVALGHAADLLGAGRADALVAGGVDAVGAALVDWLDAGGLALGRPPTDAAALLVLEPLAAASARNAAIRAVLLGHASGFEPAPAAAGAGDGLAAAITMACTRAGVAPAAVDLVVRAAPPALAALEQRALDAALGGARQVTTIAPKDVLGEPLGAAGPLGLLAAVEEAPVGARVLVLDVCPSGHVAALVARTGGDA